MLLFLVHGYILIGMRMYPSYRENYCLCLLVDVCEEGMNMFLSCAGTHVPVYTVLKLGYHKMNVII
jgi:hypothetical protein